MQQKKCKMDVSGFLLPRIVWVCFACIFFLSACASSQVARTSAGGVDRVAASMGNAYDDATATGNIGTAYQNASQTTKGALIGAGAGALTGALYSSRLGAYSGAGLGAIVGATIGVYIDKHTTLTDRLINRGVSVFVLGDHIRLVLPSPLIFEPGTPIIQPQAYSTLNMVARYLNTYDKTLIKISAYTNPRGPEQANLALSKEQAHCVERYLVETGMDARLVVADGYGGTNLVANPGSYWNSGDNYRVEISLEKLQA